MCGGGVEIELEEVRFYFFFVFMNPNLKFDFVFFKSTFHIKIDFMWHRMRRIDQTGFKINTKLHLCFAKFHIKLDFWWCWFF